MRSGLRYGRQRLFGGLRNWWRLRRNKDLGYVIYPISGNLPERNGEPRSFFQRQLPLPPPSLSIETINYNFGRIAHAPNIKGVVILLKDISASLAKLQNLRNAIKRLRDADKTVVVYTPYLTLPYYYIAAAADKIVVPPSAEFSVLGLQAQSFYIKDALNSVGISADVVQISPYKTAGNRIGESTMTPEEREQLTWLLDEQWEMLSADLAQDRNMTPDEIKRHIDQAPFGSVKSAERGLIDAAAYDDELAYLIAQWDGIAPEKKDEPAYAKLTKMGSVWKKMPRPIRRQHHQYIGVINASGTILMNDAASLLPIGGSVNVSEESLVPLLRHAEKADDMAALVLYVNSPGGSALASDLIWRQLKRIQQKKPVIAYMGDVAASGGYYIAAGGQHIIAQRGTITGSIGVITSRLAISGLLDKLDINQVSIQYGQNAGLYSNPRPLSEPERQLLWERIEETYRQFKQVVADARGISYDTLDPICEGRVWTGSQAIKHGLVDGSGDFHAAVQHIKQIANLPDDDIIDVPVRNMFSRSNSYVVPPAFEQTEPTSVSFHGYIDRLLRVFRSSVISELNGQPLMLMPYDIRFW